MGDQNQTGIQHDSVQTVTSVGNSWIICRSKSHAGRIYYFNTLSGEAAWNLSDQEIEKAKTRTKILERQSGGKFEGCPEPKDPPIDNNHNSKNPQSSQVFIPSCVYNKQIINNQFPKQTLPPVVASQCATCSSVSSFDPHSFPGPHNCNPNVWAIPPHHQIVIAPTTSPILNQLQTSVPCNNMEQRVSVQNTSLPLSHRFNQIQAIKTPYRNFRFKNGVKKFTPRNNKNSYCQKITNTPYYKKFNTFTDSIDLRQKLTARRKSNNEWNNLKDTSNYQDEEVDDSDTQIIKIIKPTIEDITPGDADDLWLKEHATFSGSHSLLNVTSLKQLVTAGENTTWYIVTDIGVLLNHMNLMNVLVNSDEKCQLMVPDFVMAALQTQSRGNDPQLLSRAHHVLQILSQQFTAGNAVMGKDPANGSSIYDFCYKLSTQDHDVVLISNDAQWKSYRNNCIITLNIEEVKDMLTNVVKPAERLEDDCNIQITIPNHTNIEEDDGISDSKTISVGIQYDNDETELNATQTNSIITSIMKEEIIPSSKQTVDVGIQTDLNLYKDSSPTIVNSFGVNAEPCNTGLLNEKSKEQFTSGNDLANSDEIPKRREIRLKRNISHQPATDNNVERKQFKWRRKRNTSVPYATDPNTTSYHNNTFNIERRSMGDQSGLELNRLDNILVPESRSSCYDPIDSSETSSSCFIQTNLQKSLDDKVVIEETSTSGVISNSADSESIHSIKQNEVIPNKMLYEGKDICKCVMFEVESPVMEDYLKMRSDEWVSRFVQIMEEVLTQILQQHPTFFNRTLPPPWTIHEATECIKKKFENDSDVQDAANRLTNVLFKISDGRGKINVDLKPSEFMEMYSYGVYLIDALQAVLSQCEDLQTAADSLAKLLSDIQDPTHDTSHTDGFMDSSHLPSADDTDTSISKTHENIAKDSAKHEEKALPELKSPSFRNDPEGRKYNLRSSQKKPIDDELPTEPPVKFIRKIDIESTFFSSLNLKKNQDSANDNNMIATNRATSLKSSSNCAQNKNPQIENKAGTQDNTEAHNAAPNGPKIIRNFSKCLEFEEKLKNKQKETMELDTFDNSQTDDEDMFYDYYDDFTHSDYDYYENEEETNEMATFEDNKEYESHLSDKTTVDINGNTCFESLVRRLVKEIQEAFLEVHTFCAKVIEELNNTKKLNAMLSPPRKLEIKEKAEAARLVIDTLSKSLNGILSREGDNFENKIQNILKEAGIQLDGNKSMEYRNIFAQYPIQANILQDAVNTVIEAVE